MKPKITFDTLRKKERSLFTAFVGVATATEYKKVFELQAFTQAHGLMNSVCELAKHNTLLIKKIEDHANDPLHYNAVMQNLIQNINNFENIVIPVRNSDFVVKEKLVQDTYFWIDERIELTLDIKNNTFYVAKLMVDEKSDALLFNNGEDGWTEYKNDIERHDYRKFSGEVAERYKEYLAERQLLKD